MGTDRKKQESEERNWIKEKNDRNGHGISIRKKRLKLSKKEHWTNTSRVRTER